MHRFAAAVQPAVVGELCQFGGGQPFVLVVHGQIGVIPVAQDAEALELLLLDGDELGGIFAAELAHLQLGNLMLL